MHAQEYRGMHACRTLLLREADERSVPQSNAYSNDALTLISIGFPLPPSITLVTCLVPKSILSIAVPSYQLLYFRHCQGCSTICALTRRSCTHLASRTEGRWPSTSPARCPTSSRVLRSPAPLCRHPPTLSLRRAAADSAARTSGWSPYSLTGTRPTVARPTVTSPTARPTHVFFGGRLLTCFTCCRLRVVLTGGWAVRADRILDLLSTFWAGQLASVVVDRVVSQANARPVRKVGRFAITLFSCVILECGLWGEDFRVARRFDGWWFIRTGSGSFRMVQ
jgi:hypothetical protein